MSTAPNRLLRHWRARFGIRKRVRQLTAELKSSFPELKRLVPSAHWGGFDSIFFLENAAAQRFGVLRLNNPHQKRQAVHTDLPRRSPAPAERIEREWTAYSTLAPLGLSPRPLWRSPDAVACDYSRFLSVRRLMESGPVDYPRLLPAIFEAVGRMHAAGIAHLDLSPGNILVCPQTYQITLIDFEYAPLEGRSFEQDCHTDWQLLISRIERRATILGQAGPMHGALGEAMGDSSYRLQIEAALSDRPN